MRKTTFILTAVLLCIVLASPAQAVVKFGAKCTKANATTTISGKKYTCKKSGLKLAWDRGVSVKLNTAVKPTVKPAVKPTVKPAVCLQVSPTDKSSGITQARANSLVGMKEVEAEGCASQLDWGYRVVSRDGEDYPATFDYRLDRVSVTIKNGLISRADVG